MAGYLTVWTWGSVEAVGVQSRKKKRRAVAKKGAEKVICSDVIGPRAARSVSKRVPEPGSRGRRRARCLPKQTRLLFRRCFWPQGRVVFLRGRGRSGFWGATHAETGCWQRACRRLTPVAFSGIICHGLRASALSALRLTGSLMGRALVDFAGSAGRSLPFCPGWV